MSARILLKKPWVIMDFFFRDHINSNSLMQLQNHVIKFLEFEG